MSRVIDIQVGDRFDQEGAIRGHWRVYGGRRNRVQWERAGAIREWADAVVERAAAGWGGCSATAVISGPESTRPVPGAVSVADRLTVETPRNAIQRLSSLLKSGGGGVVVTDDEIICGISELVESTGIFSEPAGAAVLPGLKNALVSGLMTERGSFCWLPVRASRTWERQLELSTFRRLFGRTYKRYAADVGRARSGSRWRVGAPSSTCNASGD